MDTEHGRPGKPGAYIEGKTGAKTGAITGSPAVGDTHADPGVAHLLIVHLRIVDQHVQAEVLHRQAADGGQQSVGCHHAVVLGGDQRNARVDMKTLAVSVA